MDSCQEDLIIVQDKLGIGEEMHKARDNKYETKYYSDQLNREVGYCIAIDLDGTLAEYYGWKGDEHIGEPIIPVLSKAIEEQTKGAEIWIFSARCDSDKSSKLIYDWCEKHGLNIHGTTNVKYKCFAEFWDDRAKQVVPNTGVFVEWQRDVFEANLKSTDEELAHFKSSLAAQGQPSDKKPDPFDSQVGGEHYKKYKIQPFTFCRVNNVPAAESEVITHVMRHKDKMGREDLEKAKHLIDLILESDY